MVQAALQPGPADEIESLIADLVRRYRTVRMEEADASVRIEWYMDALCDLPAWAVREALRRWRRRECGNLNYEFAPSEQTLRSVALSVVQAMKGQVAGMRRLLLAEPEIAMTDADRAVMLQKLEPVLSSLRAKA